MSRVKPLTVELREAGMGPLDIEDGLPARLYGSNFARDAREYHNSGHNWQDERLENFFVDGLLNYYIGFFSRIDLSNNYHLLTPEGYTSLNYFELVKIYSITSFFRFDDDEMLKKFFFNTFFCRNSEILFSLPKSDFSEWMKNNISDYALTAKAAIALVRRLASSKPLLKLGGKFQKIKVICEQLSARNDYGEHFIEQNRQAEILQTAICRWVEFYVDQIREKCKTCRIEEIDPDTLSLECPPHILQYLIDEGILTDNSSAQVTVSSDSPSAESSEQRDPAQSQSSPFVAAAAPSVNLAEHASSKFFDGYFFGLRSFWRGKDLQAITLKNIIDHALGENTVPHRFIANAHTGEDTRKRLENVFGVDFKYLSGLVSDDEKLSYVSAKILGTQRSEANGNPFIIKCS